MPFVHVVGVLGAGLCVLVMVGLPQLAWVRFGWWLAAGLLVYFLYGYRHSTLRLGTGPVTPRERSAGKK